MQKKGQAAMEFLMTYGWAILAAIIAIGVLAYFGVFSPGQYVGSSAIVTAPFYANAWNVAGGTASIVQLELQNNGGETLEVRNLLLSDVDGGTCGSGSGYVGNVTSGSLQTVSITCSGISSGETFKADITITYRRSGSSLDLTSTGSITDTAS